MNNREEMVSHIPVNLFVESYLENIFGPNAKYFNTNSIIEAISDDLNYISNIIHKVVNDKEFPSCVEKLYDYAFDEIDDPKEDIIFHLDGKMNMKFFMWNNYESIEKNIDWAIEAKMASICRFFVEFKKDKFESNQSYYLDEYFSTYCEEIIRLIIEYHSDGDKLCTIDDENVDAEFSDLEEDA